MKYFTNLPKIEHTPIGSENSAYVRNIFYQLNLEFDDQYVEYYRIDGFKRIDQISYDIYGTTEHWWIIANLNNIQDIMFDIPINEDILQQIAKDEAIAEYGSLDGDGMTFYLERFDELVEENDNKRTLRIISPQSINYVLSEIAKRL